MSKRRREPDAEPTSSTTFTPGALADDAEFLETALRVCARLEVTFADGAGAGAGAGASAAAAAAPGGARWRARLREALERVTSRDAGGGASALLGDAAGATYERLARPALVCAGCGNADEAAFRRDPRAACTSCAACGLVAGDREIADVDWARSFEGEANVSQFGPPPDPLLSNRANLGVGLGEAPGMSIAKKDALNLTRLAVDMGTGASAAGVTDKRTRIGYKDKMKVAAAIELTRAGDALALPKSTVDRAKLCVAGVRACRVFTRTC
jgi:hypothetical protein